MTAPHRFAVRTIVAILFMAGARIEHHEIPGTGHFLMIEKPREFKALLTGFVDKLPK